MNKEIFQKYFPESAVPYCFDLFTNNNFLFKIVKTRTSKLGDFRFYNRSKKCVITVNNNLNPYHFTVVYVHEVAHLQTFQKYHDAVLPHGNEWKDCFRMLLKPLLEQKVFPMDIEQALYQHLQNVKASSCNDVSLIKRLSKYNVTDAKTILLVEIPLMREFIYKGVRYKKMKTMKTRSLCIHVLTKQRFSMSLTAPVTPV
ncbi:MAG: hypothetical protein QM536_00150 [Chitinophagaceae bacterium]|nr:hypothetical protein [Chitinophagaceae bacterium]